MGKTKTYDTSHGNDKKEKGGNRLWLFKTLPYSYSFLAVSQNQLIMIFISNTQFSIHDLPFQVKAPWIKHFYIDIDKSDDVTYILPGYA